MTGQQLCDAVRDGDAAKFSKMLSIQGVQSFINYQDEHGFTALHLAAGKGNASVMKQLIEARCNVDLQTKYGTALDFAIENGHGAVTELLIAARCNVNLQVQNGPHPGTD